MDNSFRIDYKVIADKKIHSSQNKLRPEQIKICLVWKLGSIEAEGRMNQIPFIQDELARFSITEFLSTCTVRKI